MLALSFIYEAVIGLLTFLAFYLYYRPKEDWHGKVLMLTFLYAVYMMLVFFVTGLPTRHDFLFAWHALEHQINVIPFSQTINVIDYLLNLFLFVPFGVFLPLFSKKYQSLPKMIQTGLGFSLFIEVVQLCNERITDIDDLILNTLGAGLGYVMYRLLFRKGDSLTTGLSPIRYSVVYFLICFILFDPNFFWRF